MAAKGIQFPWLYDGGTISTNLDDIGEYRLGSLGNSQLASFGDERMVGQVHVCSVGASRCAEVTDQLDKTGIQWLQFGNDLAVWSSDQAADDFVADAPARFNALVAGAPRTVSEQDLHIVVQKGRLFQQDYDDVPVVLDKGRYLLVQLTPEQAQAVRQHEGPCYSLRAFEPGLVVFDARGRPEARRASPAWVQPLVDGVQIASFRSFVEKLAGFRTRHSHSDQFIEASKWAEEQLADMGYSTELVPISVRGKASCNVIASRAGSAPDGRQHVLVTAHLDSINTRGGPAAEAPGADDNASGSAGVLEIARVLKDHPNMADLRLILFGGEEQGLFGSQQYVAALSSEERARITAVVNMDMIGNQNTPELSVLLEGAEISRAVVEDLHDAAANHTSLDVQTSFVPHDSDHETFINNGIPAVLTIEGADASNTDIHTARDTVDKIDFELAVEILKMNVAFTAAESGRSS